MTFDDAWAHARDVEGWLTEAQARRLFAAAAGGGGRGRGRVVEIGSFRGRSAIVLAGAGAEVVCIDPHAGSDRGPQEIAADADRGSADHEAFHANLARAGVAERVRHVRAFSDAALERGPRPGRRPLRRRRAPLRPGARRPRALGRARPPRRPDARARRVVVGRRHPRAADDDRLRPPLALRRAARDRWRSSCARTRGGARNALRQLRELPWFARNVVVKALILARVRRGPWPY